MFETLDLNGRGDLHRVLAGLVGRVSVEAQRTAPDRPSRGSASLGAIH
jgi:hypothetical protein